MGLVKYQEDNEELIFECTEMKSSDEIMNPKMNNVNLQMIVPKRCKEMLRASKKLKGLLIESGEEPHMLPEFMPLLLCATVSCIAEHLNVTDMETLLDILDASDCFDITPLEEGKFVITLVFSDIFEECEVM